MTRRARRLLAAACVLGVCAAAAITVAGVSSPTASPLVGTVAVPAASSASPVVPSMSAAPVAQTGLANAAVAAAEGAANGATTLATSVLDLDTGELAVGARGAEPFYTASLSKIVVAVDVLDRRTMEGLEVGDSDLELIRRALGASDDAAMSALWSRFDGAGAASRVSERLGLAGTSAPQDRSQWGEMSVPATDMVRIWRHILEEIVQADRDVLIGSMVSAPPRARDGFDQQFGLLAPDVAGQGTVAKQGWMCCFSSSYYLNSAGVVGADQRFVVAMLTKQPRGPGWEAARQELDRIAAAAAQALTVR